MVEVTSNYKIGNISIDNGYLTLSESLGDYPKLTVFKYSNESPNLKTGDTRSAFGLRFILNSISVTICPIPGFQKQITYEYIHVSKVILEQPISVYDFVNANRKGAVSENRDSLFFPINLVVAWAKSKGRGGGSVSPANFNVEFSKNPSISESVTLKSLIDEQNEFKGLVYSFSGSTARCTPVGAGGGSLSSEIVSDYTIARTAVPTYQNTILNWSKKDEYSKNPSQKKRYIKLKADEFTLYEGDYKAHLPPGEDLVGSIVPKDLSIMSDNSGITKSCKITKYKWGQPELEINAVFGYANCALELVADPERPNSHTTAALDAVTREAIDSGNAYQETLSAIASNQFGFPDSAEWSNEPVWRVIDIQLKNYIYHPITFIVNPVVQDEDGTLQSVEIAPGYEKYLNSNIEVLIKEETRGWTLKRFAQEDPKNWAMGSITAWLNLKGLIDAEEHLSGDDYLTRQTYYWQLYTSKIKLEQYLFRKIPLLEEVDYGIVPYSKYYNDVDDVDWEVVDDLLYPDPNWSPELMIVARSRYKSAFGLSGNPEYNPFNRNYYGSNPVTITTGIEEYEFTKYDILPSKNTRTSLTGLYALTGELQEVIGGINSTVGLPGTLYPDHSYMNMSDYGIQGENPPTINPGVVLSGTLAKLEDTEDKFATTTTIRTAQDQTFKSNNTNQKYGIAEGRPPSATTRKAMYQEVTDDGQSPYEDTVTYITSSVSNNSIDIIPSVNITAANNIEEAVEGARNKLKMSILTSGSNASAQLVWTNAASSLVNKRINLPGGSWIIKGSTQTVQVTNGVPFAQPIQVTAGTLVNPSISKRTVPYDQTRASGKSSLSVTVDISTQLKLGTPVSNIPASFSRWKA